VCTGNVQYSWGFHPFLILWRAFFRQLTVTNLNKKNCYEHVLHMPVPAFVAVVQYSACMPGGWTSGAASLVLGTTHVDFCI
jgi:hypothetical protein